MSHDEVTRCAIERRRPWMAACTFEFPSTPPVVEHDSETTASIHRRGRREAAILTVAKSWTPTAETASSFCCPPPCHSARSPGLAGSWSSDNEFRPWRSRQDRSTVSSAEGRYPARASARLWRLTKAISEHQRKSDAPERSSAMKTAYGPWATSIDAGGQPATQRVLAAADDEARRDEPDQSGAVAAKPRGPSRGGRGDAGRADFPLCRGRSRRDCEGGGAAGREDRCPDAGRGVGRSVRVGRCC